MTPSLAELPPEIHSAIFSHIPREEWQQTASSLIRAMPASRVPLRHLFQHIHLRSAESVVQLYRRLRGHREEQSWVKEFSLETWTVDADVVVNIVALLSQLSSITLFVGPNFAPEHLEDMLERPRKTLRYISLRFRPYVQKATYYQFLKARGAYYDTALEALSKWPAANLPTLSIVQDPLDAEIARKHNFAQPLVFFRLDPVSNLACSPYLRSLTSLRLRIPSRNVPYTLYTSPRCTPELRILDLSTSNVRLVDVEALAARFQQLIHLIVDGCSITSGDQESEWANVGKTCALATVKAAKDREKRLKVWLEVRAASGSSEPELATPPEVLDATRRARPGRRGLATAAISLRDSPARTTAPADQTKIIVPKVHIVPSSPTLRSLSATTSKLHKDKHDAIRAEFERGWDEGLAQLTAIRKRLFQSWKNGVRIMRIAGNQGVEEGLGGLEDVEGEDAFYGRNGHGNVWSVPVLCLAGKGDPAEHVDGCGHVATSCVWPDRI